jgi:mevalonate kinase
VPGDLEDRQPGEQVFHGSPSGIDTGLSVYNQPLGFVFDGGLPRIKPLKARGITLVVSAVPREEDTYTYVSRVKARCASSPEAKDQLKVLGALSEELLSPREITPGALGAMTQEAQSILRDWGLVPQALDRVIQKTVGEGALGGKISGAGGGGAFYLVAEDPPAAANLQSFLQSPQGNQGIPLLIPPFLVEI